MYCECSHLFLLKACVIVYMSKSINICSINSSATYLPAACHVIRHVVPAATWWAGRYMPEKCIYSVKYRKNCVSIGK